MSEVIELDRKKSESKFGYTPVELNLYAKRVEANWGKDPHAVRRAISDWMLREAYRDGPFNGDLYQRLSGEMQRFLKEPAANETTSYAIECDIRKETEQPQYAAAAEIMRIFERVCAANS